MLEIQAAMPGKSMYGSASSPNPDGSCCKVPKRYEVWAPNDISIQDN